MKKDSIILIICNVFYFQIESITQKQESSPCLFYELDAVVENF